MTPAQKKTTVTLAARFREACLAGHTREQFADVLRGDEFDEQQVRAALDQHILSTRCRGCDGPLSLDTFAGWTTYWKSLSAPCHAACRTAGMKQEAFDCQEVDADCNDCRHFERGKGVGLPVVVEGATHDYHLTANGRCAKFDRPARANPNFCSGWTCFEHRRA